MKAYQKPRILVVRDYIKYVRLQGTGQLPPTIAPPLLVTPDCDSPGNCGPTLGVQCTGGSDFLIFFELANTNCSDVADPLALGCQIFADNEQLTNCFLDIPCSDSGCSGNGAFYQIFCNMVGSACESFNDLTNIVEIRCPEGSIFCDDLENLE